MKNRPTEKWIVVDDFSIELAKWRDKNYPTDCVFDLGNTPFALLKINAPQLRVAVTGKTLEKALFDHGMGLSMLANIPDWLAHPLGIFRSDTVEGMSVVVLSNAIKNESPIILPIELHSKIERREVNRIKSVYDKPMGVVENWKRRGLQLA